MQNAVPDVAMRTLSGRYETYVDEVRRLVEAGFEVARRTETIDPRVSEIVREAGLSNQAFYRHFRSKDELLLAMLDEGLRQLVSYLEREMRVQATPAGKVRRWVEGIMAQAASGAAAERTRPFVLNRMRLADRFPEESARSDDTLVAPLLGALRALPSPDPDRDAAAIYRLTMGHMHACIVQRTPPAAADVDHLVGFVLAALKRRP